MNRAGVIWIFALMFLICADITARTLFNSPIPGVPEMVSLSLVACLFLQLAFAVSTNRLTRTEILNQYLTSKQGSIANDWNRILSIICLFVMAVIAMGTWPDFIKAFRTNEFAGVEGIYTVTVWPIKLIIVLGALFAGLEFLKQAMSSIKAPEKNRGIQRLTVLLAPVLILFVIFFLWQIQADDRTIGISMVVLVLLLIFSGMPIAIALLLVGFIGIGLIKQDMVIAMRALSLTAQASISEYVFATVPLFVLMGMFVNVSEIGRDSFKAAAKIFGRISGGLGIATVVANAVFAAITGISIASAAIFSKIAVPEMVRQGYSARFAVGLTAGSSVLGMLIPPSLLLIIYGVIAEVSIGDLFLAAILPGLLLALAFAVGVIVMSRFWPEYVGDTDRSEVQIEPEDTHLFRGLAPVLLLILLVLGGIYGGIFTPTEAGAAGAFAAMCISLLKRRLNWKALWQLINETGQVTVTILFLIISASAFSRMLTLTGIPQEMGTYLGGSGMGVGGFLISYLFLLILLGTVLDSTSILLILLPLVLPVATGLDCNLIWFGIITVIGVEIGLMTPPLGLSVYVIKSSLDDDSISLADIFKGAFPFVVITLLVTLLLMGFPQISLLLI